MATGGLAGPARCLEQPSKDGTSPGDDYIRIALVHAPDMTRNALEKIVSTQR